MQNATRYRKSREYTQIIMRTTQNANINIIKNHMLLI